MTKGSYDENSITVLSDVRHVQHRPGMYVGATDDPHHLFSETFDNALDEVQSGYSDKVIVNVDTSLNKYSVRDFGRGIPHGKKKMDDGSEKEILEVLCTKSFSGSKFNNDSYTYRSGLNGVGLVCVNALSDTISMESYRSGKSVSLLTDHGSVTSLEYSDTNEKNGTYVSFIPNEAIFSNKRIPIEFIKDRCKIASAFGMTTELYVDGVQQDVTADIFDLIRSEDDKDLVDYCKFNGEVQVDTGEKFKYAVIYTNDTSYRSKGYTNLLYNSQGGTHIRVFDQSLGEAWQKYDLGNALWKDLYLGVRIVVAAFISDPSFSSQTKERLTTEKKYLEKFIPLLKADIQKWLDNNEDIRNGLIKRFNEYRESQNKLLSKKEIRDLVIVNKDTSGTVRRKSVIPKLVECSSKLRNDTELYICEGDSAMGGLLQGRDVKTQSILPIRGKIMNVSHFPDDIVRCLKNEEIRSIVNAIGAGVSTDCDYERSRYERIVICTDADEDGNNIAALVISIFVNLLPDLVKNGALYLCNPPLYGWKDKSGLKFAFTQDEIPEGISEYKRFKGLGEMNPDELEASLTNKNSRSLTKVEFPDDVNLFNNILTSAQLKYDILYDLGLIRYSN